ncbi:MAG TPA: hypothetical protein VJ994_13755 [Paracoccaceae bacterium]|nr:hypothetical protein [Paracoccaceae bacterium]
MDDELRIEVYPSEAEAKAAVKDMVAQGFDAAGPYGGHVVFSSLAMGDDGRAAGHQDAFTVVGRKAG